MQTVQAVLALLISIHTPANGDPSAATVAHRAAPVRLADNNPPQIQDPEQQEQQAEQAQQQQNGNGQGHG